MAEQIIEGRSSRITISPLGHAVKKSMEQGRGGTSGAGEREWSGKASRRSEVWDLEGRKGEVIGSKGIG